MTQNANYENLVSDKAIFNIINITARHKTNANYENLVVDKVEKRVTKNLFHDSC